MSEHTATPASQNGSEPLREAEPGELYQQLGHLTRQLHDTLGQLGVMPRLQAAAHGLPDARSRLNYVAEKTADAAHRVLNAVDAAKAEHRQMTASARDLLGELNRSTSGPESGSAVGAPLAASLAASLAAFADSHQAAAARLDAHLTDIMMAQDFHDLTGQVVRKVLEVANALEDNLVKLLVQAAPADAHGETEALTTTNAVPDQGLQGPVVAGARQGDVITDQGEVDDLLASLGF